MIKSIPPLEAPQRQARRAAERVVETRLGQSTTSFTPLWRILRIGR
jgi:hypothetical protein